MIFAKIYDYAKCKINYTYSVSKFYYYLDFSGLIRKIKDKFSTSEVVFFDFNKSSFDDFSFNDNNVLYLEKSLYDANTILDIEIKNIEKPLIHDQISEDFTKSKLFEKYNYDLVISLDTVNLNTTLSPFYEYSNLLDVPSKYISVYLEEGSYVLENYVEANYIVPYFSVTDYLLPFIVDKKIIDSPLITENIGPFVDKKVILEPETVLEVSLKHFSKPAFLDTYSISDNYNYDLTKNIPIENLISTESLTKIFTNIYVDPINVFEVIPKNNIKKLNLEVVSSTDIFGKHFKLYLEEGPYEKIYSGYVESGYYSIEGSGIISDSLTI